MLTVERPKNRRCQATSDCQVLHPLSKCLTRREKTWPNNKKISEPGICSCNKDCSQFDFFKVCAEIPSSGQILEFANVCEASLFECRYRFAIDFLCTGRNEVDCQDLGLQSQSFGRSGKPGLRTCRGRDDFEICNGNGFCLEDMGTGMKFCHCSIYYNGVYCDIFASTGEKTAEPVRTLSDDNGSKATIGLAGSCLYLHGTLLLVVVFFTGTIITLMLKFGPGGSGAYERNDPGTRSFVCSRRSTVKSVAGQPSPSKSIRSAIISTNATALPIIRPPRIRHHSFSQMRSGKLDSSLADIASGDDSLSLRKGRLSNRGSLLSLASREDTRASLPMTGQRQNLMARHRWNLIKKEVLPK